MAAALVLGLAACGDGDAAETTDRASTATPAVSDTGDESPAPAVKPADGLKLSEETWRT